MKLKYGCGKFGGDFTLYHTTYGFRFVLARNDHKDRFRLHNIFDTHRKGLTGNFVNGIKQTGVVLDSVFRKVNEVGYGTLCSMQSVNRSDIEAGASYLILMQQNVNILKEAYYGIN